MARHGACERQFAAAADTSHAVETKGRKPSKNLFPLQNLTPFHPRINPNSMSRTLVRESVYVCLCQNPGLGARSFRRRGENYIRRTTDRGIVFTQRPTTFYTRRNVRGTINPRGNSRDTRTHSIPLYDTGNGNDKGEQ